MNIFISRKGNPCAEKEISLFECPRGLFKSCQKKKKKTAYVRTSPVFENNFINIQLLLSLEQNPKSNSVSLKVPMFG